jgi:hypothetical protein
VVRDAKGEAQTILVVAGKIAEPGANVILFENRRLGRANCMESELVLF